MRLSRFVATVPLLQAVCAATGPNWPGFKGLRYFFAFGDSYTTVGFNSWASVPTDANPLGVGYPGSTTAGGANWVGYLTTQYNQSKFWSYDYAVSGNEVAGVATQVNTDFLPHAGTKPDYAPWGSTNSLFATFVGINDLNRGAPIVATINTLFTLQESLYNAGARNFLFINVPPEDRAPFSIDWAGNKNTTLKGLIATWNDQLKASAAAFQAKHSDIATFYYDSWSLYTKLLDSPSAYGFTDVNMTGGSFWIDTIHPRSKVHQYMAADLSTFLQSQTGTANPSTTTAKTTSTVASTTKSTSAAVTTTKTSSAPASTATGTVPKYGQW
ncbi:carbohydrate esterase family 16 protein [Ceratobasidium sp. AG-Ba]|nr:carbohydrate esterase family 16 protein [Ceratobasidium sp. AG-Ba]